MAYSDEVLADAPAVYYRLNDASGLPQDSSGNGLHVSEVRGTPDYGEPGAILTDAGNDAIGFETATNDGLRRADDALLDMANEFTLECWCKRQVVGTTQVLFAKDTGSYILVWADTNELVLLQFGTPGAVAESSVLVSDTTDWHYLVCTKDGADTHIYIDADDVTVLLADQTFVSTAGSLFVNCLFFDTLVGEQTLDEVAIYPTALTPERVLAHYQAAGYVDQSLAWITA